jgi:hypothetical protein
MSWHKAHSAQAAYSFPASEPIRPTGVSTTRNLEASPIPKPCAPGLVWRHSAMPVEEGCIRADYEHRVEQRWSVKLAVDFVDPENHGRTGIRSGVLNGPQVGPCKIKTPLDPDLP